MSENKKGFMGKIITVENALKWFEDDPNLESKCKYRREIKGKSNFTTHTEAECEYIGKWTRDSSPLETVDQYYVGISNFDPDSSPEAWEHYRTHYSPDTFNTAQNGTGYTFSFLGWTPSKDKTVFRLVSVSTNDLERKFNNQWRIRRQANKGCFDASSLERLGGDCDFNFNEEKRTAFKKYLGEAHGTLLDHCCRLHHSLLNFSLMQGTGGMQKFKGTLCDYDRLDRFVYFLDRYYKTPVKDLRNTAIAIKAEVANRSALIHYLNQFDNIYDYCAKIYFLPTKLYHSGKMIEKVDTTRCEWQCLFKSNQELIKDLIKWGAEDFKENSTENTNHNQNLATEYMRLAVRFWQAKEKYFKLMDKIFEDEKKK